MSQRGSSRQCAPWTNTYSIQGDRYSVVLCDQTFGIGSISSGLVCTVGLKSMFPRPGSLTVGRSVPWLNPHRGLEGAPPPETWCSPRSSPATCPGSHTDRAIKRACGEGFWRTIFGSTCWLRFVVRLPVSVTARLNPRQRKQGEG